LRWRGAVGGSAEVVRPVRVDVDRPRVVVVDDTLCGE
jgi:hypothetical protein